MALKNWINRKIKYYVTEKTFVDRETGLIINEEEFKNEYHRAKTERTRKYAYDTCVNIEIITGYRKRQTTIF